MKKIMFIALIALLLILPAGALYAQNPTPTPGGLGGFFNDASSTTTPSGSSSGNTTTNQRASPTPNPLARTLAASNYIVVTSGNWYDAQGKLANDSVYVMMLGVSPDPKSTDAVKQITSGLAALVNAYPNAANYHVLLLNGPYVHDASTTAKTLQLLNSQLLAPEAFLRDLLAQMRTTNLASGSTTSGTNAVATATRGSTTSNATSVPTRRPTTASTCNPPAGQARLWVKNGYSGVMRFTVGGAEWGTHDYDIPADGQYHFIDMPPSDRYTYSASIPGVGKASQRLVDIFGPFVAGQCYYLPFQP